MNTCKEELIRLKYEIQFDVTSRVDTAPQIKLSDIIVQSQ